jgi:hypothetical protein
MDHALYNRLLEIARAGEVTRYSDVAPLVGLDMSRDNDRARMGELLDEISSFEFGGGRPLLSAVVIRIDTNIPGPGFFVLATQTGLFQGGDRTVFWVRELTRVHEYWSKS